MTSGSKRIWGLSLLLAVFAAAGVVRAGQLRPEQVGANADWVLHLDMERQDKGGVIRSLLDVPAVRESRAFRSLGLDLEGGILGLTAYGKLDEAGNGVILLRANNLKQDELERTARAAAGYREEMRGRHKIFLLAPGQAGERGGWVCFAEKNLLLTGTTLEEVRHGLDVVDGKAPRLDAGALARKWHVPPEGGCTFMLALNPKARRDALNGDPSVGSAWQKLSGCTLTADEKSGRLTAALCLISDSEEQAGLVAQVAQGMIVMAQMSMDADEGASAGGGAREREAWRQCREGLGRMKAVRDGKTVSVTLSLPSDAVLALVKVSLGEKPAETETKHGTP